MNEPMEERTLRRLAQNHQELDQNAETSDEEKRVCCQHHRVGGYLRLRELLFLEKVSIWGAPRPPMWRTGSPTWWEMCRHVKRCGYYRNISHEAPNYTARQPAPQAPTALLKIPPGDVIFKTNSKVVTS